MHSDVDDAPDLDDAPDADQDADDRPAPEKTEAQIADEWLRDGGFYNWLLERSFDPDQLNPRAVLWLVEQYEREQVARERERERQRQTAAAREQEQEREQARERQRETAAAREQVRAEARARAEATLRERLNDPAWVRGEDEASLAAVAAWRLSNLNTVTLKVDDDGLRARLQAHYAALRDAIATREREAASIRAENARTRLERAARSTPPTPEPPPVDVTALVDRDALARFLVAQREHLTIVLGRRVADEVKDVPPDWGTVSQRCAAWSVWAEAPDEVTREFAMRALVDADLPRELDAIVREQLRERWDTSHFEPPEDEDEDEAEEPEPRTEARGRRRAAKGESLQRRIEGFVKRFRKEHAGRCPSKNEIAGGVGGTRGRTLKTIDEMVADRECLLQGPDLDHDGYWLDG